MQVFLLEKQAEIAELCRKRHVRSLSVFGSAVRDDFDPERSDVDLLVEFDDLPESKSFTGFLHLRDELSGLLQHEVDLLERKAIRNRFLKRAIDEECMALYAA